MGSKQRPVAIKTLKTHTMSASKFLEEAVIMKELDHPKIVKLLAIVTKGEPLMIITEFMDKGDLRNYLIGEEGPYVEEEELRAISYQVGGIDNRYMYVCISVKLRVCVSISVFLSLMLSICFFLSQCL